MESVEFFDYLGSMRTKSSRWAREVKSRNGVEKSSIQQEDSFRQQIGLQKQKLVKCYIWSKAVCGAENSTLQKGDRTCLERFQL